MTSCPAFVRKQAWSSYENWNSVRGGAGFWEVGTTTFATIPHAFVVCAPDRFGRRIIKASISIVVHVNDQNNKAWQIRIQAEIKDIDIGIEDED